MAGIQNNHIRFINGSGRGIVRRRQRVHHTRGVIDIHLATKCLNEELLAQRQTLARPTVAIALEVIDADSD